MASGAVAGNAIRNKMARTPSAVKNIVTGTGNKVRGELDKAQDEKIANTQGYKAMRENQIARNNKRARESILKDKNQIAKYNLSKKHLPALQVLLAKKKVFP